MVTAMPATYSLAPVTKPFRVNVTGTFLLARACACDATHDEGRGAARSSPSRPPTASLRLIRACTGGQMVPSCPKSLSTIGSKGAISIDAGARRGIREHRNFA